MTSQPSQLTAQILKLIDRQRPSKPSLQSVMENPVSIFFAIKQMYSSFKKENESRILRSKIYDLRVYDEKTCLADRSYTEVNMESLFCSHSKNQRIELIKNLLALKDYLPEILQAQLISFISNQIIKIDDLPTVLSFFKRILTSKPSLNDKAGLYKQIQQKMIGKLLAFRQLFNLAQINQVCTFLYGLPRLGLEIIQLIAMLFDKVEDITDFQDLGLLYLNIHKKLSSTQEIDKKRLQKSFMKITSKEHFQEIEEKVTKIQQKKSKSIEDDIFLEQLYQEAIRKISEWVTKPTDVLSQQETLLNQKQIQTINFIILALQNEAVSAAQQKNEMESILKVWSRFIDWYHFNSKYGYWLSYVSEKLTSLFQKIFQSPKVALKLMELLLATEAGLIITGKSSVNSSLVANLHESLSSYVVREIVTVEKLRSRYLLNKIARKIIAFGLNCDQFDIYFKIIFNSSNLEYLDVILQTFDLPNCLEFFKQVITNSNKRAVLEDYLLKVHEQRPKKYTDFFVKVDGYYSGQIFEFQDYFLLRFLSKSISGETAICLLRQMATYTPSKYNIQIMNTLIKNFQKKPEYKVVYHQAIRSLHVILSTYEAQNLGVQFKKHLRDIVESKVIA